MQLAFVRPLLRLYRGSRSDRSSDDGSSTTASAPAPNEQQRDLERGVARSFLAGGLSGSEFRTRPSNKCHASRSHVRPNAGATSSEFAFDLHSLRLNEFQYTRGQLCFVRGHLCFEQMYSANLLLVCIVCDSTNCSTHEANCASYEATCASS